MNRSLIETLIGAVVLGVAGLFLMFAYSAADLGRSGGYALYADFTSVGALKVGSDVRMSGIKVGTVTRQRLEPETYLARVTLSIDSSVQLPTDSSASISSEGLLGGNFIELAPGGAPEVLKPGDRIQYTQDAVDLTQLLSRFIFSAGQTAPGQGGGSLGGGGQGSSAPAGAADKAMPEPLPK